MPRLTRQESRQNTRQAIIRATEQELLAGGIYGASIRRICSSAGFTLGAFYSNFRDKDELLMEVVDTHARHIFASLDNISASEGGGTAEELEGWLQELQGDQILALSLEFAMYAKHNPKFGVLYGKSRAQWRVRLADVLARLFERQGRTPRIPVRQMALGMNALWHGFAIEAFVPGTDTADKIIPVFLDALLEPARKQQENESCALHG